MVRDRSSARVLVVDDSPDTLELIRRQLDSEGFDVFTAANVDDAIQTLETQELELVITDHRMPKVTGMDLIRHVRENYGTTAVIMITGFASIPDAVRAVKEGAEEYLAKPFTNEELLEAVQRALRKVRNRHVGEAQTDGSGLEQYGLIGASPPIGRVWKATDKASTTGATVLISGESGTGKELVARAIHYESARASNPFVAVNCGGIPEGLLESELFGHKKGSFTGASETRAGFFQTADGGSIFLDEISEMSLFMQVKLLRVLEDRQVQMVGASSPRKVDVRIIAATNKELMSQVKKDLFREDLYFRLNVIPIVLPPLRERGDDVLRLADHFAARFAEEAGKAKPAFSDKVLTVFKKYGWPGNVRELQNIVQRLVVMTDGDVIDVSDLPALMRYSAPREGGLDRTLAEMERDYISRVLGSVRGNKTHAAEVLGIDRKTLREKLRDPHKVD